MKKTSLRLIALCILSVLTLSILTACGSSSDGAAEGSASVGGGATIILVDEDGTEYTYDIAKAGSDLRTTLKEEGLVTEEEAGKFMIETIDGHTALMDDGVLWLPCDADKNQIQGLFEEITVNEGDTIYLIYTIAPNFDD